MEKTCTFSKKINITYLVLFIIIFGSFFVFTLLETLGVSTALNAYENNASEIVEDSKETSWNYEKNELERNYQFNLTITIVTILIGLVVFFATFYSRSKLRINEKGIFVLGITGKNYMEKYKWKTIDFIEVGYSQGLSSMFFEKALIIHQSSETSNSIPYESFKNADEIIRKVQSYNLVRLNRRESFELEGDRLGSFLKKTINHLKSYYKIYMSFSLIVMIFASLNRIFNDSPISLITTIATFYFGIKANVAMNIFSFKAMNNNYLSFTEAWEKTKGKFGRYYSSVLVQGLFQIPFILIALYIYNANGSIFVKGIMFLIFGLLYSVTILWLFLLPYIASITSSKKSYFSLNASLLEVVYKKIIPLVLFELVSIGVLIVCFIMYDLFIPMGLLNQLMLTQIVFNLIKLPFYSAYIMRVIHKAAFLEVGENDAVKEAI